MKYMISALCLLGLATAASAQETRLLRAEENAYNNPTTLNLLFDPAIKSPLSDLHLWINCVAETIQDPTYEIKIQNFALKNLGQDRIQTYRIVNQEGESVAQTCRAIKNHLEANTNNRAEIVFDDDAGTATLKSLLQKGSYEDL